VLSLRLADWASIFEKNFWRHLSIKCWTQEIGVAGKLRKYITKTFTISPELILKNWTGRTYWTEVNCLQGLYIRLVSPWDSHSWEANSRSLSHEISRLLCNPNVHYRVHKNQPKVRGCMRRFVTSVFFNDQELSAYRPTTNMEDHPLSTVRHWLFNTFTTIWRPSPPPTTWWLPCHGIREQLNKSKHTEQDDKTHMDVDIHAHTPTGIETPSYCSNGGRPYATYNLKSSPYTTNGEWIKNYATGEKKYTKASWLENFNLRRLNNTGDLSLDSRPISTELKRVSHNLYPSQ
jgi:hypothetical protein